MGLGARRLASFTLVLSACALLRPAVLDACTAFCATGNGVVLVGNNEDYVNPRTKVWFVPAKDGDYGRMYVGFDDMYPQGGMNERGLWFDGFTAPLVHMPESGLPRFSGNIVDRAMAECATVEEVVRLFKQYDRSFLAAAILMFADSSGDAVSIEPNAIVRKTGAHHVQTNFQQSKTMSGPGDRRYRTASEMLEHAGGNVSVDLFKSILAATAQKGTSPTLYSNVYELRSRTMYLYYFRDFDRAVTFRLEEELKKGAHVLDIPALFPPNPKADLFAERRKPRPTVPLGPFVAQLAVVTVTLVGVALFVFIRGGRRIRVALAAGAGLVVLSGVATGVALNLQPRRAAEWTEFSLGPASGTSTWIGTNGLRSEGMALRVALATAYEIPAIRVVGPSWLATTRYSISASVPADAEDSFRPLLQKELQARLQLRTHLETRPFDVFVLTATQAPRLERVDGNNPSIWVHDAGLVAQETSMELLAKTLQGPLQHPVIDETALPGSYDFELEWSADKIPSISGALDRLGLRLTPAQREMEVLVVDDVRRDPALVLLDRVGRLTGNAPSNVRRAVANLMTVR